MTDPDPPGLTSAREAFDTMLRVLERRYHRTKDLGAGYLLDEAHYAYDGPDGAPLTGDPAAWREWLACVDEIRHQRSEQRADGRLTRDAAVDAMYLFVENFEEGTGFEEVRRYLAEISSSRAQLEGEWLKAVAELTEPLPDA